MAGTSLSLNPGEVLLVAVALSQLIFEQRVGLGEDQRVGPPGPACLMLDGRGVRDVTAALLCCSRQAPETRRP